MDTKRMGLATQRPWRLLGWRSEQPPRPRRRRRPSPRNRSRHHRGRVTDLRLPIEPHTVGMEVAIRHYDAEGTLRSETSSSTTTAILNPANGKTVSTRVSGPTRDVYYDDGSIAESSSGSTTGPHRLRTRERLHQGRSVVLVPTGETDEDGFRPRLRRRQLQASSRQPGVCDVLPERVLPRKPRSAATRDEIVRAQHATTRRSNSWLRRWPDASSARRP
jgi:hypothetical protein